MFVNAVLVYPEPKLNNFTKSIFETEHQEACKALMKVFIIIILSILYDSTPFNSTYLGQNSIKIYKIFF